jgi:hypothetical protein
MIGRNGYYYYFLRMIFKRHFLHQFTKVAMAVYRLVRMHGKDLEWAEKQYHLFIEKAGQCPVIVENRQRIIGIIEVIGQSPETRHCI